VYSRAGGHAYESVYPGPIGAILSPQLTGVEDNASLPYASSLCGACFDACPVRIDIPSLLVHLRTRHVEERPGPSAEAVSMAAMSWVMSRPGRFRGGERLLRLGRLLGPRTRLMRAWTAARDLPQAPAQTFRDWWRDRDA
jgi:L-lactate dehydrogenase complex protein LldF